MRPSEVLRRSADYLDRHGVESPRETAEVLLMKMLGVDRAGLYSREEGLDARTARAFGRALCQRCTGVPVQHITGEQDFAGLVLMVEPGVFVPRPETEGLVVAALDRLPVSGRPIVVDVGTGTGAVALAVKRARPSTQVWATDLGPAAVDLARRNAERLGLDITVLEGDLLDPVPGGELVDLVVSNPPYIEEQELDRLSPEVLADPVEALVGGTEVHGRLADAARPRLRAGGWLVLEIGADQGRRVADILRAAGYEEVGVLPDLAGRDRVAVARRPQG